MFRLDIIFVLVQSLEKLIEWVLLGWVIIIIMMMLHRSINDDAAPTCGYHMMGWQNDVLLIAKDEIDMHRHTSVKILERKMDVDSNINNNTG
jgi:hypothetical protein